jgi:hypothetical protein
MVTSAESSMETTNGSKRAKLGQATMSKIQNIGLVGNNAAFCLQLQAGKLSNQILRHRTLNNITMTMLNIDDLTASIYGCRKPFENLYDCEDVSIILKQSLKSDHPPAANGGNGRQSFISKIFSGDRGDVVPHGHGHGVCKPQEEPRVGIECGHHEIDCKSLALLYHCNPDVFVACPTNQMKTMKLMLAQVNLASQKHKDKAHA